MHNSKKILIIGPAWVGDMVMAQTLFKVLRAQNPSITLDVLAPPWSRPLLERMPEVNEALDLPFGHGELNLRKRYQLARSLRERQYQQVIVLPNSFKSALIARWAKIPERTGWLGEYRWFLLNDFRYLNKERLPLMIDRFMALAFSREAYDKNDPILRETLGSTQFFPSLKIDSASLSSSLEKFKLNTDRPVLGLCPGAEFGPSKRWPSEYYAAVAREKLDQGWQVWIFGSAKDAVVAEEIQALTNHRCVTLAGKTALTEAIDLLSVSTAVVSNDSGLMHMAAALNRPLVAVYGSSSPRFTPPLGEQVKIIRIELPCSPCFKRECPLGHHLCMKNLQSALAIEALNSFNLK